MLRCKFCPVGRNTPSFKRVIQYVNHQRVHSSITNKLHCGIIKCQDSFKNENLLRYHLITNHQFKSRTFLVNVQPLTSLSGRYICTFEICQQHCDTYGAYMKHLKSHTNKKQEIKCPYNYCNSKFVVTSSFTSHLTRKHSNRQLEPHFVNEYEKETENFAQENQIFPSIASPSDGVLLESQFSSTANKRQANHSEYSNAEYLQNLAVLFLKMEAEFIVPVSTIQRIITQLSNVHKLGNDILKQNFRKQMTEEGFLPEQIERFLEILNTDPFFDSYKKLESDHRRKKFYKQTFDFATPETVVIDDKKETFFSYVPITQTLQLLFKDKSIQNDLILDPTNIVNDNDILEDFTDGTEFKKIVFFKEFPNGLKIILFQDGFEVCNPIGSAKSKHKILGVYLTLGNLPSHLRYHTNNIKLVALCKEKEFNHKKVFGKIVDELKVIESEGIQVNGKFIKGSIVFIAGDNLGSHFLGGFGENFSKAPYFCRFCLVNREEFYKKGKIFEEYLTRDINAYNRAVSKLPRTGTCEGLKFDSIFNKLDNYHVTSPGLAPCIGHDLLEGVGAHDMLLFIRMLKKEKWFNITTINERLAKFKYTSKDLRDKPCFVPLLPKNIKLKGGAMQLHNFLRLFPVLMEDKIKDPFHEAWHCIILLNEIVEIVMAPTIDKKILPYLSLIIREYIHLRRKLFPNVPLRPKHHYMIHYPSLILRYGPLIKVWAMRFESKHSYFKRTVRYTQNFINVLKTLSEKHELFQSLIRLGSDIRQTVECFNKTNFNVKLYSTNVERCVSNMGWTGEEKKNVYECTKIVYKGTTYEKGTVLFIRQRGYRFGVTLGSICFILLKENSIYILFEILNNEFIPHIHAYKVQYGTNIYECHALIDLSVYKPIGMYKLRTSLYAIPDHGFVSSQ